MSMAPETAVGPLAQAPPDRPTADLEQLLRQVIAVIFGDRVMDPNEQRVFRGFMEEVAMRAQAGGGIGRGGTPQPEEPGASPMDMNSNTSDYGDGAGEPTGDEY